MSQLVEKTRFDWLLQPETTAQRDVWDEDLYGHRSFAVVPSLGSLVPGWLLIVPRRPMVNLKALTRSEMAELSELQQSISRDLAVFSGQVYAFEHGGDHYGSVMGCGVDQAHLHMVPLPFDLLDEAVAQADSGIEWKLHPGMPLTGLPPIGEYVVVWRVDGSVGAIGMVSRPVSQWMRRIIARKLGIEGWDYRTNPQTAIIRETVETLRPGTPLTK